MLRTDAPGDGPRLAVKDAIDVAGLPTTAGSAAVAALARPAGRDAAVVAAARAAGARIVGKTNLTEFCLAADGLNPWSGTPVNPLDPGRVPGGSSGGSAVAVATGEADVAFGTDTGGSVRVPAACCGIAALKTTHGRVPLDGVHPLAPSLDTVGPMGRDVAAVVLGMRLIEPGFAPVPYEPGGSIARLRAPGVRPEIDAAVDDALRRVAPLTDVRSEEFHEAGMANGAIVGHEAWNLHGHHLERPDLVGERVRDRLPMLESIARKYLPWARETQRALRAELDAILGRHPAIALPVLATVAPEPDDDLHGDLPLTRLTGPVNVAGLPAVALPVPLPGSHLPASVQLIGPAGGEERLCGLAAAIESALR
ncbi:amidase [Actinomadura algeriensis]|uniref:Amidase n=1 Tax=Actinomadura algeriensis TaxID=1679523 RepID=A0ABR9JU17_9ACTN|nr:amidase [Actinomadura algeriensis]MBE1534053.1 amidase [Actinomadura algeriensis]